MWMLLGVFAMSIIVVLCMIIAIEADCFPCERVSCPQLSQECLKYFYRDNCPYCVKSDGEKCGGILNLWGSCGPDSTSEVCLQVITIYFSVFMQ